jgi:3D (Asp-Asp-Asp) domain-containing protein
MFAMWLTATPAFFGHIGASSRAEGLSPAAAPAPSAARAIVTIPEQLWPKPVIPNHPVLPFLRKLVNGDFGSQPAWKLPMLLHALTQKPEDAVITAYCEEDNDGGGCYTRWGTHVRRGICAADARYFGPGSVVWIGDPVNESLIVEDTGSAIKGPNRFDVCVSGHHALCDEIGRRHTSYIVLYRVPPKRNWGDKPSGWEPPVLSLKLAANVSG